MNTTIYKTLDTYPSAESSYYGLFVACKYDTCSTLYAQMWFTVVYMKLKRHYHGKRTLQFNFFGVLDRETLSQ